MSDLKLSGSRWAVAMRPRDPNEEHRAATTLELFFDLVFVVAVAQVAAALHHAVAEAHVVEALPSYAMGFFAIWWAWMNFTWFASAYDTDDIAYRLAIFVQLAGALILAAGVPRAFDQRDLGVVVLGYVIMRLALVAQWLRAGRHDVARRACTRRYAVGVTAVQVGWVLLLAVPERGVLPGFVVLAVAELAVPMWAERAAPTPWHAGHIAERYGLFTIILLGESILAATVAVQAGLDEGGLSAGIVGIAIGGLLIVLSMWWLYFDRDAGQMLVSLPVAFAWGYGHLVLFAAAAAVGAGIAVAVDVATEHSELGLRGAGYAAVVPVVIFVLSVWLLHRDPQAPEAVRRFATPLAAALLLLTPFLSAPVLAAGLVMGALVAVRVIALPAS